MGAETWSLTAKLCDSCKAVSATVFCGADTAFLCLACDSKIHAANKLASRHARVWVCEVCEQAPASFTCKADAAALCVTCDRDIHSANPLARRHERLPVVPFYDSAAAAAKSHGAAGSASPGGDDDDNKYFNGVVPVQKKTETRHVPGPVVDGFPTYEIDFAAGSKPPFMYNFASQSISQSVSSSSMEVGVVPDHNAMADVSNAPFNRTSGGDAVPNPVSGLDREARVLRYREKRKNRKFEKTIRYASRKAYAETRPRIKGRFAKRAETEADSLLAADASYGVVPSY
nr:zinc finger protein CONSTANS-LIKE 4-like [Ipomoea batatas]GMD50116.1 zinc finger protein CONSTANS-LIKE 4-like [Ipomoea batatas]